METIDAVTINTPTFTHKQIALDCIRAGKHVYVEKPITQTAEELVEVLAEARKSNQSLFRRLQWIAPTSDAYVPPVSIQRTYGRNLSYDH